MRRAAVLAAALLLAGCGADGPPTAPAKVPVQKTGITISGEVTTGIAKVGAQ
jgi:ABC-type glycerol-3-phosphate transport system substrate-binding protein